MAWFQIVHSVSTCVQQQSGNRFKARQFTTQGSFQALEATRVRLREARIFRDEKMLYALQHTTGGMLRSVIQPVRPPGAAVGFLNLINNRL